MQPKTSCILGSPAIGHKTAIFLTIFKLVLKSFHREPHYCKLSFPDPNFLQVRLRPCPLANGHSMANGLLTHLTSRATSSLIHKEQQSMARGLALLVGVLAFIFALPSGSEVRVKRGCFFLSQLVHKRSLRDR